jgi:predicted RNA binding protein YcfA (HicA-like mRNA interferase family)
MPYTFLEIQKRLLRLGYVAVRQNGSHVLFSNGRTIFPVPRHAGKTISPGVESKIIRLVGIGKDGFKNALKLKR